MEKQEPGHRTAKVRKEFDWKGFGVQIGSAAVQGVAFALGGVAVQRLTRGLQSAPQTPSADVVPLRRNG